MKLTKPLLKYMVIGSRIGYLKGPSLIISFLFTALSALAHPSRRGIPEPCKKYKDSSGSRFQDKVCMVFQNRAKGTRTVPAHVSRTRYAWYSGTFKKYNKEFLQFRLTFPGHGIYGIQEPSKSTTRSSPSSGSIVHLTVFL